LVSFNPRFPGQYYDAETGFHYNYHRYYDPYTGRYITSDPIGLTGGLNTYAYVNNNPLTFVDPLGLLNPGNAACALGPNPVCIGSVVVDVLALAAGVVLGVLAASPDEDCDEDKDCSKASNWQLAQAGIPQGKEHKFKDEWGAVPNSRYDICACSDGSIVIRGQGQCGRSGPTIPTDRRWR